MATVAVPGTGEITAPNQGGLDEGVRHGSVAVDGAEQFGFSGIAPGGEVADAGGEEADFPPSLRFGAASPRRFTEPQLGERRLVISCMRAGVLAGLHRQFTKLLLSLLSHAGMKMACQADLSRHSEATAEAWQGRKAGLRTCVLRRGSLRRPLTQMAKAGRLPRTCTVFRPGKSRRFTIKVCSPIGGKGNGRASGYRALYSGLEDRRVSLNTYARQ